MRFISAPLFAAIALLTASCATGGATTQTGANVDPMPPMPAEVRALLSPDHLCGRQTSPPQRMLNEEGQRLYSEGRRGWVVVRVTVGTNGAVIHSEVLASAPQGLFDQSALGLENTNTYPARQDECSTVDVVWIGNPYR